MGPNFIFILADDIGYAELGCYGGRAPISPNVDRLAAEGLLFTQGYSNSPVSCGLSRLETLALVDLPAALPRIVAGLHNSLAVSLLIAVSTEMLLSTDCLGTYLVKSQEEFRVADGMAGLLVIALGSLLINGAAGVIEWRLLRWHYLRLGISQA